MYRTYWLGMRLMDIYPNLPRQPYKVCFINVCYSLLWGATTNDIPFDNLDKY